MRNLELLAPAGNKEMLRAAIENGADAVYMGLTKFNARVMTNNFTKDDYIDAIDYAHKRNAKVFLTLNTLMEDEDIKEALLDVIDLYKNGLDAVIVQDLGLAGIIHEVMPDLDLHASTQMSVTNLSQVKYLESLGFKRIVLGRELSIKEIKEICENTSAEIEVFVHGALCVSVSGQCLLSSLIGGRSGNKGACAQPCRTKFSLYNSKKEFITKTYLLSKKDIYGLDHIKKLIDAGITSFKIEGRNKPPYYVGVTIDKYRKYIDNLNKVSKEDEKELLQVFNRSGKSYGYLDKVEKIDSITRLTPKNTGIFLGQIVNQKKSFVKVKLEENIDIHDGIEIYDTTKELPYSTIVTCVRDNKYNIINKEVKSGEYVWLGDIKENITPGSNIYKTSSNKLNKSLEQTWKNTGIYKNKIHVNAYIKLCLNENIKIRMNSEDGKIIEHEIDYIPQKASRISLSKENIIKNLQKTNDTVFSIDNINVELGDNLFVPISTINQIRRETLEKLENLYVIRRKEDNLINKLDKALKSIQKIKDIDLSKKIITHSTYMYRYSLEKLNSINTTRVYINVLDYIKNEKEILNNKKSKKIYLELPNVAFKNTLKILDMNLEKISKDIDGYIISSIGDIKRCIYLKNKYNHLELICNSTLNITNLYTAKHYLDLGINKFILMPDASEKVVEKLDKKLDIELPSSLDTAMTSRYCILGSFINKDEICSMPCIKENYYLTDQKDSRLDIVCSNVDCIMKIVKRIKTCKEKNISIRENIL